jgi:hypothetical protein
LDPQSANRHAPAVKLPSGTTDAVLVLAPGLRLTGVVRDAESKRVERARVKLFRADVAVEVEARDADDAGCFEFSGLAPGTYRLSAEDLLGRSGSVPRIEISATTSSARVDVKIGVNTR